MKHIKANREKLSNMTNEELAEFIYEGSRCICCIYNGTECYIPHCKDGILKWLNLKTED